MAVMCTRVPAEEPPSFPRPGSPGTGHRAGWAQAGGHFGGRGIHAEEEWGKEGCEVAAESSRNVPVG